MWHGYMVPQWVTKMSYKKMWHKGNICGKLEKRQLLHILQAYIWNVRGLAAVGKFYLEFIKVKQGNLLGGLEVFKSYYYCFSDVKNNSQTLKDSEP